MVLLLRLTQNQNLSTRVPQASITQEDPTKPDAVNFQAKAAQTLTEKTIVLIKIIQVMTQTCRLLLLKRNLFLLVTGRSGQVPEEIYQIELKSMICTTNSPSDDNNSKTDNEGTKVTAVRQSQKHKAERQLDQAVQGTGQQLAALNIDTIGRSLEEQKVPAIGAEQAKLFPLVPEALLDGREEPVNEDSSDAKTTIAAKEKDGVAKSLSATTGIEQATEDADAFYDPKKLHGQSGSSFFPKFNTRSRIRTTRQRQSLAARMGDTDYAFSFASSANGPFSPPAPRMALSTSTVPIIDLEPESPPTTAVALSQELLKHTETTPVLTPSSMPVTLSSPIIPKAPPTTPSRSIFDRIQRDSNGNPVRMPMPFSTPVFLAAGVQISEIKDEEGTRRGSDEDEENVDDEKHEPGDGNENDKHQDEANNVDDWEDALSDDGLSASEGNDVNEQTAPKDNHNEGNNLGVDHNDSRVELARADSTASIQPLVSTLVKNREITQTLIDSTNDEETAPAVGIITFLPHGTKMNVPPPNLTQDSTEKQQSTVQVTRNGVTSILKTSRTLLPELSPTKSVQFAEESKYTVHEYTPKTTPPLRQKPEPVSPSPVVSAATQENNNIDTSQSEQTKSSGIQDRDMPDVSITAEVSQDQEMPDTGVDISGPSSAWESLACESQTAMDTTMPIPDALQGIPSAHQNKCPPFHPQLSNVASHVEATGLMDIDINIAASTSERPAEQMSALSNILTSAQMVQLMPLTFSISPPGPVQAQKSDPLSNVKPAMDLDQPQNLSRVTASTKAPYDAKHIIIERPISNPPPNRSSDRQVAADDDVDVNVDDMSYFEDMYNTIPSANSAMASHGQSANASRNSGRSAQSSSSKDPVKVIAKSNLKKSDRPTIKPISRFSKVSVALPSGSTTSDALSSGLLDPAESDANMSKPRKKPISMQELSERFNEQQELSSISQRSSSPQVLIFDTQSEKQGTPPAELDFHFSGSSAPVAQTSSIAQPTQSAHASTSMPNFANTSIGFRLAPGPGFNTGVLGSPQASLNSLSQLPGLAYDIEPQLAETQDDTAAQNVDPAGGSSILDAAPPVANNFGPNPYGAEAVDTNADASTDPYDSPDDDDSLFGANALSRISFPKEETDHDAGVAGMACNDEDDDSLFSANIRTRSLPEEEADSDAVNAGTTATQVLANAPQLDGEAAGVHDNGSDHASQDPWNHTYSGESKQESKDRDVFEMEWFGGNNEVTTDAQSHSNIISNPSTSLAMLVEDIEIDKSEFVDPTPSSYTPLTISSPQRPEQNGLSESRWSDFKNVTPENDHPCLAAAADTAQVLSGSGGQSDLRSSIWSNAGNPYRPNVNSPSFVITGPAQTPSSNAQPGPAQSGWSSNKNPTVSWQNQLIAATNVAHTPLGDSRHPEGLSQSQWSTPTNQLSYDISIRPAASVQQRSGIRSSFNHTAAPLSWADEVENVSPSKGNSTTIMNAHAPPRNMFFSSGAMYNMDKAGNSAQELKAKSYLDAAKLDQSLPKVFPENKTLCRGFQSPLTNCTVPQCRHSHDVKKGLCWFFAKGTCEMGDHCRYSHDWKKALSDDVDME